MSLEANFNNTFSTYRQGASATYPYSENGAWSRVINELGCYISDATLRKVSDDGKAFYVKVRRVRTLTYSWLPGDRVYIDSLVYETLTYEDFDGLGKEAVTVCKYLPLSATDIVEVIGA